VHQEDGGTDFPEEKVCCWWHLKAALSEFLTGELTEDGYSGVEVQVTPTGTEIIFIYQGTEGSWTEGSVDLGIDCSSTEEI
jgi:ribosomal protein S3